MRLISGIALASLAATAALAAPLRPQAVSASARWVVHADIDLLKKTEVGKLMLEEFGREAAARKLAALQAVLNFDPRTDLADVTAYGIDNKPESVVVLLRGTFDPVRLVTLAKANDSYQATAYRDLTIHSWIDANKGVGTRAHAAVAPGNTIVMAQSEAAVKSALDVLGGRVANVAKAGPLTGSDFQSGKSFLRLVADTSAMSVANTPAAAFGLQTRAVQMAVSEAAGFLRGEVVVEKETPELAAQLEQIARGLIAMSVLQSQQANPEAAKLAQAIEIAAAGRAVTFSLRLSTAEAVAFVRQQIEAGKSRTLVAPPAPPAGVR